MVFLNEFVRCGNYRGFSYSHYVSWYNGFEYRAKYVGLNESLGLARFLKSKGFTDIQIVTEDYKYYKLIRTTRKKFE